MIQLAFSWGDVGRVMREQTRKTTWKQASGALGETSDESDFSLLAWDSFSLWASVVRGFSHGLRTPNEGKNQRYLKNWADVADKICFGRN